MPLTHERAFRVRHYECGADGLVHHANYLRYNAESEEKCALALRPCKREF